MTQNVGTYDEAVTGSKQIFFSFSFLLKRDTTNYRGTLVENVKKSKFNPPYSTILLTLLSVTLPHVFVKYGKAACL
jgi:hypothetical protein